MVLRDNRENVSFITQANGKDSKDICYFNEVGRIPSKHRMETTRSMYDLPFRYRLSFVPILHTALVAHSYNKIEVAIPIFPYFIFKLFRIELCNFLKGQVTNLKPAIQITSISIKSESIPFSGEFGHIVRVVGVPFLPLKCDRSTAESTTANFKHTQRKFSYIGDC